MRDQSSWFIARGCGGLPTVSSERPKKNLALGKAAAGGGRLSGVVGGRHAPYWYRFLLSLSWVLGLVLGRMGSQKQRQGTSNRHSDIDLQGPGTGT